MITLSDILLGVLLPAGVAAAVILRGRLIGGARAARAAVPLGVGGGFVAGHAALLGVPRVPPLEAVNWLFYAAIVLGAVGMIDLLLSAPSPRRNSGTTAYGEPAPGAILDYDAADRPALRGAWGLALRLLGVLALGLVLTWLLTRPLLVFHWTGSAGPVWIGGIGAVMAVVWLLLDRLADRTDGRPSLVVALAGVSAVSGAVIAMSGSQKLGQTTGLLTAGLFAAAVLSLPMRKLQAGRGVVLVYALLQTALIAVATEHLYASLATAHALLLLVAAPLAWLGELVPARRPRLRATARVAAAMVPATVAAILAGILFARAANEYPGYSY